MIKTDHCSSWRRASSVCESSRLRPRPHSQCCQSPTQSCDKQKHMYSVHNHVIKHTASKLSYFKLILCKKIAFSRSAYNLFYMQSWPTNYYCIPKAHKLDHHSVVFFIIITPQISSQSVIMFRLGRHLDHHWIPTYTHSYHSPPHWDQRWLGPWWSRWVLPELRGHR